MLTSKTEASAMGEGDHATLTEAVNATVACHSTVHESKLASSRLLGNGVHVRAELAEHRPAVLRHHARPVQVLQRLVRVHLHTESL